jgi:hypothetical protein
VWADSATAVPSVLAAFTIATDLAWVSRAPRAQADGAAAILQLRRRDHGAPTLTSIRDTTQGNGPRTHGAPRPQSRGGRPSVPGAVKCSMSWAIWRGSCVARCPMSINNGRNPADLGGAVRRPNRSLPDPPTRHRRRRERQPRTTRTRCVVPSSTSGTAAPPPVSGCPSSSATATPRLTPCGFSTTISYVAV